MVTKFIYICSFLVDPADKTLKGSVHPLAVINGASGEAMDTDQSPASQVMNAIDDAIAGGMRWLTL